MNELKKQLKEIALSSDTYKKVTVIGDKYGLMLDLQDELVAEIQDLIMGFKPAKDFVKNIGNRLEVDSDKANAIAIDVNSQVLEPIQDKLQKIQGEAELIAKSKEEAEVPENLPTAPTISAIEQAGQFIVESDPASHSEQYNDTTTITKEATLNKIEEDHIPLVDHLLTTPISNPQKVEVKKPYTVDPYREQM